MKKIISILMIFIFSLVSVFAAETEEEKIDLISNEITETSVDLSWDKKEGLLFKIAYGKKSKSIEDYSDITDIIEGNNITISELEAGTSYYFSLIGYTELADSIDLSNELVLNTKMEVTSTFSIENAENNELNKIKLEFSNDLESGDSVTREFKVVAVEDEFDTFNVLSTSLDENNSKNLFLTLDSNLSIGVEYKVIALDIRDDKGNNIEYGVDSEVSFISKEFVEVEVIEEPEEEVIEPAVELNAAEEKEDNKAGIDLTEEEVEKNIISVAEDTNNLPKTGPEQILLFILAFILGSLIFVVRYKKA